MFFWLFGLVLGSLVVCLFGCLVWCLVSSLVGGSVVCCICLFVVSSVFYRFVSILDTT